MRIISFAADQCSTPRYTGASHVQMPCSGTLPPSLHPEGILFHWAETINSLFLIETMYFSELSLPGQSGHAESYKIIQ